MTGARKTKIIKPWNLEIQGTATEAVDSSCIGISDTMAPEETLRLAVELGFSHVCHRQGWAFDQELRSSQMLVQSPEAFLEFPIASIFSPQKLSRVQERKLINVEAQFSASAQKRKVLDHVSKAMESVGVPRTLSDDVVLVADEMYTNAIFNAPFVDRLTNKNPGISRFNTDVKLDSGKHVDLFIANDGERLLIGCKDPYGSLDPNRYLRKIRSTYMVGAAATMNFGPGGAGLGSYIIYNTGTSFYLGVWPGRATIVCCVIPMGKSNRMRAQFPKHLHCIEG